MPLLKPLESDNPVHEQVSPTTDWARMVAMLAAAKNKKSKRQSGRIRTQLAIKQSASRWFEVPQGTKQQAAKQRGTT